MTEEEIRSIVRHEIAIWTSEEHARKLALDDQYVAEIKERFKANPGDGPIQTEIKALILREALGQ